MQDLPINRQITELSGDVVNNKLLFFLNFCCLEAIGAIFKFSVSDLVFAVFLAENKGKRIYPSAYLERLNANRIFDTFVEF